VLDVWAVIPAPREFKVWWNIHWKCLRKENATSRPGSLEVKLEKPIPRRKDLKVWGKYLGKVTGPEECWDWRHFLLRSHSLPLRGQHRPFSASQKICLLLKCSSKSKWWFRIMSWEMQALVSSTLYTS
jgi:hypothetical protein